MTFNSPRLPLHTTVSECKLPRVLFMGLSPLSLPKCSHVYLKVDECVLAAAAVAVCRALLLRCSCPGSPHYACAYLSLGRPTRNLSSHAQYESRTSGINFQNKHYKRKLTF